MRWSLEWLVLTAVRLSPLRRPSVRPGGPLLAGLAAVVAVGGCVVGGAVLALHGRAGCAVAFGVSIAVAIAAAATALLGGWAPHRATLACASFTVALATWTVGATAWTFAASTARWIAFASAIAYILQPLALLVAYAVRPLRVVHVLEVRRLDLPA